jgi:glycosyltransferase involved in cell wall biosynthesis
MSELVSVIMSAYDAARYIGEAIESVLAQTHREFEFIIVDDGSTDGTLAIAREWASRDPRIRVIEQANAGMGAALNRALSLATSEMIVRLDADDVMRADRIERQLAFLGERPSLALAASFIEYLDDRGRPCGGVTSRLVTEEAVRRLVTEDDLIGLYHSSVIMRRSAVLAVGGYRPQFWPADDIDLWNRLVEKGDGLLVQPEYLTRYRIHGRSASLTSLRQALLKTAWVKACMRSRRRGLPEPTEAEFLATRRAQPWQRRADRWRKDTARILFKKAGLHWAERRIGPLVLALVAASLLEPGYVVAKSSDKRLSPRAAAF